MLNDYLWSILRSFWRRTYETKCLSLKHRVASRTKPNTIALNEDEEKFFLLVKSTSESFKIAMTTKPITSVHFSSEFAVFAAEMFKTALLQRLMMRARVIVECNLRVNCSQECAICVAVC